MVPTKTVGLKSLHLQESRVRYTLAGIKSPFKIGEVGGGGGGFRNPWNPPLLLDVIEKLSPDVLMHTQFLDSYTPCVKGTPQLK